MDEFDLYKLSGCYTNNPNWQYLIKELLTNGFFVLLKVRGKTVAKCYKYCVLSPYLQNGKIFATDIYKFKGNLHYERLGVYGGRNVEIVERPKPYEFVIHNKTFSSYYLDKGIEHFNQNLTLRKNNG